MAGTMSERELRISCGSTLAAEIDNPASGFTNAAAMARIGSTLYFAKVNKNSKSKILKSTKFQSGTITSSAVFATLDYFVYGMTAKNQLLYLTCKDSSNVPFLIKLGLDGTILAKIRLSRVYVGIASYRTDEFILMEYLDKNNPSQFNFVIGSMEDLDVSANKGIHFSVTANDAEEYTKANGIYFERNYGLFILTNHYISDYSSCKNRILLVKSADYIEGGNYRPFAVFQADMDSKKYKQFNFEGITLYKENMYVFANVIGLTDTGLKDRVVYQKGISFKKWRSDVSRAGNGYFAFNGSVKEGVLIPSIEIKGASVRNIQSMAMDDDDAACCLKCDVDNLYAAMYKTSNPETVEPKVIATFGEAEDTRLYHCNGMTYNPVDKKLYVVGYEMGKNGVCYVTVLATDGSMLRKFQLSEQEYGITYFGNDTGKSEFILMNKYNDGNPSRICFNKAVYDGKNMIEEERDFYVEIQRAEQSITLQDVYYHQFYGMFIPVSKKIVENKKEKTISEIYHVAKEDVEKAMKSSSNLEITPDFMISINPDKYSGYEVESMDLNKKTKKMIMCGNFHVDGDKDHDMYHVLNTLTFV